MPNDDVAMTNDNKGMADNNVGITNNNAGITNRTLGQWVATWGQQHEDNKQQCRGDMNRGGMRLATVDTWDGIQCPTLAMNTRQWGFSFVFFISL